MTQFTQKYALIQLLEDVAEGTQFSMDSWPLHSTIVEVFAITWDVPMMVKALQKLLATHSQAYSVAEGDAFLGPEKQTHVVIASENQRPRYAAL